MAIPKEPRQLMINLMYLVLTAMLALNVSAEIILAFFALDNGNIATITTLDKELDEKVKGVNALLEEESKEAFRPITPAMEKVRSLSSDFIAYVEALRDELIDQSGDKNGTKDDGDYTESHGHMYPKGKKNKDVTTRLLYDNANPQSKGELLKQELLKTRDEMLAVYTGLLDSFGIKPFGLPQEEIDQMKAAALANIPLNVDDKQWQDEGKTNWSQMMFDHMPVAAVLPLLSKMQNDAKTAEATLVNNMAGLAGGREVVFDAFFPVVQAKSAYVIAGDPFEAQISVGSYSSSIDPSNIRITVNGSGLSVDNTGKATYKTGTSSSSTGKKTLKLRAEVTNPLTGEKIGGDGTYEYEVGLRSVAVSADKMNVFYIGVDNPISVSASGVSSNSLKVKGEGPINVSGSGSKYNVKATKTGTANIVVSGDGLPPTKFEYRVKRIPDPVVKLGGTKTDGVVKSGEMRAQRGLLPMLENFDFEAKCNMVSFTMYHVKAKSDPAEYKNNGGSFSGGAAQAIKSAKPGDTYTFVDVKVKCPGDSNSRKVNGLAFQIK